jgi:putative ABC transport system substrate-binding protein
MPHVQNNTVAQARTAALSQALQQLGWCVGRNLTLEVHYAGPFAAGIRQHAAELVALGPDVILANGSTAVGPLLEVTRTAAASSTILRARAGTQPDLCNSNMA